jgi:hypothetical protein
LGFPAAREDVLVLGELIWMDRKGLPPNTPYCGFRGEKAVCSRQKISLTSGETVAVTLVTLFFIIGLGTSGCIGADR